MAADHMTGLCGGVAQAQRFDLHSGHQRFDDVWIEGSAGAAPKLRVVDDVYVDPWASRN